MLYKSVLLVSRSASGSFLLSASTSSQVSRLALHQSTAMFCKATLLAVALTLAASASPIARSPAPSGIRIPLQKRGSLKNADGTFNHEAAVREIVKLKKYVAPCWPTSAVSDHAVRFSASTARTSSTWRRTSGVRHSPRVLRSSLWQPFQSPSRSVVLSSSPIKRMISNGPARSPSVAPLRASLSISTPARPTSGFPLPHARPVAAMPSTRPAPRPTAARRAARSLLATAMGQLLRALRTPTLVNQ